MDQGKSFFNLLLDFSFQEFVTTRLIKVMYAILLALIAVATLFGLVAALIGMRDSVLTGLGLLCLTPLVALLYVIGARVWMELIIVVFRIAENMSELVRLQRQEAASPPKESDM